MGPAIALFLISAAAGYWVLARSAMIRSKCAMLMIVAALCAAPVAQAQSHGTKPHSMKAAKPKAKAHPKKAGTPAAKKSKSQPKKPVKQHAQKKPSVKKNPRARNSS